MIVHIISSLKSELEIPAAVEIRPEALPVPLPVPAPVAKLIPTPGKNNTVGACFFL
jgi:hypothetical protein